MIVVFFFDRKKNLWKFGRFFMVKSQECQIKGSSTGREDWLDDNLSMKVDYHVTSLISTSHVLMNKSGFENLISYIGKLEENISSISSLS